MKKVLIACVMAVVLALPVAAEEGALTVGVKRLSTDTALRVAVAALEACREKGVMVGVTVTDRDGIPQVVLRDSIASTITLDISRGKAYAAAMFGAPTADLKDEANTPIGRTAGVVISAGGEPIRVAGVLYGAVGVSGGAAAGPEAARECALAGIEAVREDLEMDG